MLKLLWFSSWRIYLVGPKVHSGFSIRCYRKSRMNLRANPIECVLIFPPVLVLYLIFLFISFRGVIKIYNHPTPVLLPGKIPWTEEPGGLQSMGSRRVRHDWVSSLSLFTFMHWRRKWQPTPVFLPGESQGRGSLVGCRLWGCTELDTTEVT